MWNNTYFMILPKEIRSEIFKLYKKENVPNLILEKLMDVYMIAIPSIIDEVIIFFCIFDDIHIKIEYHPTDMSQFKLVKTGILPIIDKYESSRLLEILSKTEHSTQHKIGTILRELNIEIPQIYKRWL